jgi:ATP-dependent protease HslVU (ClpYQ) peptidase subunit
VGESYVGLVGWSAIQAALESALEHACPLPEVRDERELFEWSRTLHRSLKDEYFLNASGRDGDPLETSRLWMFVMNRHGLFALDALRSVEECIRFAAAGSGSDYALGAMYAAFELDLSAEEIARLGVEAGIEFDDGSLGPITLKKMKLEA